MVSLFTCQWWALQGGRGGSPSRAHPLIHVPRPTSRSLQCRNENMIPHWFHISKHWQLRLLEHTNKQEARLLGIVPVFCSCLYPCNLNPLIKSVNKKSVLLFTSNLLCNYFKSIKYWLSVKLYNSTELCNMLKFAGGEFICSKICNKHIHRKMMCLLWMGHDLWVFNFSSLQGFAFGWLWLLLVHLVVLVPKPWELRLSQAVSKALVVHFLVRGLLQVLNIRRSWRWAADVTVLP